MEKTHSTDIEELLQNIPQQERIQYLEHVFGDADPETLKEIAGCLNAYVEYNGSIYRAAGALYMHKNTLQYRLQKIKQMTGFDPRILSEAVPLYVALILSGLGNMEMFGETGTV